VITNDLVVTVFVSLRIKVKLFERKQSGKLSLLANRLEKRTLSSKQPTVVREKGTLLKTQGHRRTRQTQTI